MPKNLTQKQTLILFGGVLALFAIMGIVFLNFRTVKQSNSFTLTIWGTDPSKVFNDLLAPYTGGGNSGSKITYVQVDPAEYQTKLLSALAAGTGPDIFEIGNRDLPEWQSVLAPMPATVQSSAAFNLVTLQNEFPTVVGQDFVSGNQIYALPLSVDTLALIYNRDLLDSAGIAFAPKTWDDFQSDVAKLKVVNPEGQITQSAAAIGGSRKSIPNAPDILFLLMLQNGTQMTRPDQGSSVIFSNGGGANNPGLSAFNFYLQFANAASPYYTWNDGMGDALDNFIQGKTAMMLDYQAALAAIKAKAPFLNVGVAPAPQPTGATVSISYPKYLGLAVARTGQVAQAWNFVLDLTTLESNEKIYTNDTGAPPALRSAIQNDMSDPTLSVFASQALTARSWYEAKGAGKIDDIIDTAIQSVQSGSQNSERALSAAQQSINAL